MTLRAFHVRSALFFALVTLVMTWPMGVAPDVLYSTRQDTLLSIWNLWWVAGALGDASREILASQYLFHPFGSGLEVQPLTLLQTVGVAPLTLLFGPVCAFNTLVLCSFWFGGWMTSLFAKELTGSGIGACIAGIIFSFSPFHYTYLPELNLLPIGLIPLYLWLALRFQRCPSRKRALLAGLSLAAVGCGSWYFGIAAGMVGLVLSIGRLRGAGSESVPGRDAPVLGERIRLEIWHWSACAALLGPLVLRLSVGFIGKTYEQLEERAGLGWVMENFKATSFTLALWSYVGLLALLLAAYGCFPFRRAIPLLCMSFASMVLAVGQSVEIGSMTLTLPFAWLQHLPLLESLRYPDRFFVLTQLSIALLACLGVQRLGKRWSAGTGLPLWVTAGLGALLLVEYWPGRLHSVEPPSELLAPAAAAGDAGAVFHIPARLRSRDGEHMFQQLLHERPIASGYLTRRDQGVLNELTSDAYIGPLLGTRPGALPEDLREGLLRHGFAYVAVQKQDLFLGTNMLPGSVLGPFVLGGSKFLEQRLFPGYQPPLQVRQVGRDWIRALSAVFGPPVVRDPRGALFRLSDSRH